ncbi:MAG: hypothetical protein ACYSX0_21655, partial [Planctomycetota bacterium]
MAKPWRGRLLRTFLLLLVLLTALVAVAPWLAGMAPVRDLMQGGRTNLDDILGRVAKPKPPPKVLPERRPEPRPFEIHLRDCTIHLQRTPPRPRPVDPFKEDPEILPADAHAARIDLEGLRLDLVVDAPRTELRFAGGVRVNGKGGHVEAALLADGGKVSGEATVRALDLSLLGALAGEEVAGAIDLEAEGF